MPANPYLHPRDEILETIARIYRYRMTTTSGGNLSIREPNGDVWITPARVDKGALTRADIVRVRPDGSVDGNRAPSSELPLHQAIYRARPDVRGIVHAHPVALVAFSMVHRVPNTRLFHQAAKVCGEVAFAEYALPGSADLGRVVADKFAQGLDSVILENHGVVTSGDNLQDAFWRFETLEFSGKTAIKAGLLGGQVRSLTDLEIDSATTHRPPLAEFTHDSPSSAEKELRQQLCEFVRRAYRQRLFISTQGSFSTRVDESSFLITPSLVDRGAIGPADISLVNDSRAQAGTTPSRAARLHDAIYRRHPDVHAIINAYPVNATAFSVSGMSLDTRTIPESYVVVRKPGFATYGLQFSKPDDLAAMVSSAQPAIVLENDGVLVTGNSILEAFDRLEVLESTAEAVINSKALGPIVPISDDAIVDLERAFFGGS